LERHLGKLVQSQEADFRNYLNQFHPRSDLFICSCDYSEAGARRRSIRQKSEKGTAMGQQSQQRRNIARLAILLAALCADLRAGEIHDASQRGDRRNVVRLLRADPCLLESTDGNGGTPLYYAALYQKPETVSLLLAAGANPDAKGPSNGNLLHWAAQQGNNDLARALLDHGASVNAKDRYGRTPLYYAALYSKPETAALLLAAGADPDAKGPSNGGLLHWTAQQGNVDLVTALVEHGASVNAENTCGHTPLYCAVVYRKPEAIALLLAAGADPNAKGPSNGTLLHWAVQQASTDLMRLLLRHKASVNIENRYGHTPLYYAVLARRSDTTGLLLAHGADPGPGFSALHWQNAVDDADELARHLGSRERIRVLLAVFGLKAMGRQAVPSLVDAMLADDDNVRNRAVRLLAATGAEAVPELGRLLRDPFADVRLRAVFALGEIGPPAAPLLAEALRDPEYGVRCLAADALAGIGPKGKPAAAAVHKAIKDEVPVVRFHAARALWAIEQDPAAIALLAECLSGKDPTIRLMAAVALEAIGPPGKHSSDALAEATCDSQEAVALAATRALRSIEGDLPTLAQKLASVVQRQSPERRAKISRALIGIDPQKPPSVAMARCLATLQQGKDEAVWCAAAMLLAAWGSEASPAVPNLTASLHQTSKDDTRSCLQWALNCIQPTQANGVR
jgi:ankyrin repeat protein/HEAT repeat protein